MTDAITLSAFIALVDGLVLSTPPASGPFGGPENVEQALLACVPRRLSSAGRLAVRRLHTDVVLRQCCDGFDRSDVTKVVGVLKSAFRSRGTGDRDTLDWPALVSIALGAPPPVRLSRPESLDPRLSTLVQGIQTLRELGYAVDLPDEGGMVMTPAELARIENEISSTGKKLGLKLAELAMLRISVTWSPVVDRFLLGRVGGAFDHDVRPTPPWACLYHLGLRFAFHRAAPRVSPARVERLVRLVEAVLAVEDIVVPFFELIHGSPEDLVDVTMKSARFDVAYTLEQASPAHARRFLDFLFARQDIAGLSDDAGYGASEVMAIARLLLDKAAQANASSFVTISADEIGRLAGLGKKAGTILREVFRHAHAPNRALVTPPRDDTIDSSFRPLLMAGGRLVMQPRPMASRAIVNAAVDWCRRRTGDGFDHNVLGYAFEAFAMHAFEAAGIKVRSGTYGPKGKTLQCDAVVEAGKAVVVLELKSKVLRRMGKSGDGVSLLSDVGQAVVRPLAQAMRHALNLRQGSVALDDAGPAIALVGREVLMVAINRADMASIHDRPFLRYLLQTGCRATFGAEDPARQTEFEGIHQYFSQIRERAAGAGIDLGDALAFDECWSLSIFQLLTMLDHATDADGFVRELSRSRRMMTSARDFYREYAWRVTTEGG